MERVSLQEFKQLAYNAFYWTSFSPDKLGERVLLEHEEQLNKDLLNIPQDDQERYIESYKKYLSAWLNSHSRCASSVITGGANFNVRRAEKANQSQHAKLEQLSEWREKALKAILRKVENNKSDALKQHEAFDALRENIMERVIIIHDINTGVETRYYKAAFVNHIYNKVETYAKRGEVDVVNRAIDLIRSCNKSMSVIITERHKFFKLGEVAESYREKQLDRACRENTSIQFKGGLIINNYQENRIQLIFDQKPSFNTIYQLKHLAFKWSPRFNAWQRQMTQNAVDATKQFLNQNNLTLN